MFERGMQVRLIADPGRIGSIVSDTAKVMGVRRYWRVRFTDNTSWHPENALEAVEDQVADPLELLIQGKFGRARDLRGALTHIRLSGRLANLIYSMETTNTDFYAYQFKPVLSFLDSPSNGILIADEVGLGKTIEAGLIWTELRSRFDARRFMVLCPAILREKWKSELQNRFGIRSEIKSGSEVFEALREIRQGTLSDVAIVASLQGLRPPRDYHEGTARNAPRARLATFLEEHAYEEPLLDLLVIDEAHYLRNRETMTARLGRLMKAVSEHLVLLSATPVHLRSEDLFNLLNLVDEDTFNQPRVFDDMLESNEPVLIARDYIQSGDITRDHLLTLLRDAQESPMLRDSRQLATLIDTCPADDELSDIAVRSRLAARIESINLLGRVITRTRKRDVQEWRVTREAVPEAVSMTDAERHLYETVTQIVREYCGTRDAHEGFLSVMPQRQMTSSMPAALRAWQSRAQDRQVPLEEELYEDMGLLADSEQIAIGPLVSTLVARVGEMGDLGQLWQEDSKYQRLLEMLGPYLKANPFEKIVLFAYFRPTLQYLSERLQQDGITNVVLSGAQSDAKQEILEHFGRPSGPSVLLASEVASEGIDLQFSHVIVNYDLPWNPMKVEQRIGRLDRIGQQFSKITIWNLFYDETIDARIYRRLYERLDLFRRSLGDIEAILGDEIRRLTLDLMQGQLTPEQEEQRIEQTQLAIENTRQQEETLESQASSLIAHGDYILNQVKAAKDLGRTISKDDLYNYVRDFLNTHYTGCQLQQLATGDLVFEIELSAKARVDLDEFLRLFRLQGKTRLGAPGKVRCVFENKVGGRITGNGEVINQFHPLIQFISHAIKDSDSVYHPVVAIKLSAFDLPTAPKGRFLFFVDRWSISGLRDIETLLFLVKHLDTGEYFSDDDLAEQLVTIAARHGEDWLEAVVEVDPTAVEREVHDCYDVCLTRYDNYVSRIEAENHDRADIQSKALLAHKDSALVSLRAVRDKHVVADRDQLVKATDGRIEQLKARIDQQLKKIASNRHIAHSRAEVVIGVLEVA